VVDGGGQLARYGRLAGTGGEGGTRLGAGPVNQSCIWGTALVALCAERRHMYEV